MLSGIIEKEPFHHSHQDTASWHVDIRGFFKSKSQPIMIGYQMNATNY
jgi:hypothetical protein